MNLSQEELECGCYPNTGIICSKHEAENVMEKYTKQMAENHAKLIDKNFWLIVKQKPKYMPAWLYKMTIKELIEFQEHRSPREEDN